MKFSTISLLLLAAAPAAEAFTRMPFVASRTATITSLAAEEEATDPKTGEKVHFNPWKNQITDGWDEPTPGPHRSPWTEQNVDGYEIDIGLEKGTPGRKPSSNPRADETPDSWNEMHADPEARKSKGKAFVNIYKDQPADGWEEPTQGPHKVPFGGSQAIDGYELDVGMMEKKKKKSQDSAAKEE